MSIVLGSTGFILVRAHGEEDWEYIRHCRFETRWELIETGRRDDQNRERELREARAMIIDTRPSEGGFRKRFRYADKRLNQAFILLDEKKSRCGTLWLKESRDYTGKVFAWILLLFVEPDHRGRGLGRMLVSEAETWARKHGMDGVKLNFRPTNQRARRLYEKSGFVIEKIQMLTEF